MGNVDISQFQGQIMYTTKQKTYLKKAFKEPPATSN